MDKKAVESEIEALIAYEPDTAEDNMTTCMDNIHAQLEDILSRDSFAYILVNAHVNVNARPSIPEVSHASEKVYMRTCRGQVKACIMREARKCMKLNPSQAFIGTGLVPTTIGTDN